MIANALKENKALKLSHFSAGRDRLENKGISSLAEAFKQMGSLEVIEVPQNGIKKDGMLALLLSLKENTETLREININDNWIKQEAVDRLVEVLFRVKKLEKLNISDSNMGNKAVLMVMRAIKDSVAFETLKELKCNFNEVESSKVAIECMQIMLEMKNLKVIEFMGNDFSNKIKKEYALKFQEQEKKFTYKDEEEDEGEEEEGEEEEEEEEEEEVIQKREDEVSKKLAELKL